VSSFDHALNGTLKLYPAGSGEFRLEPGIEYEWLHYPFDENSGYENFKQFVKFKHYIGKNWNYGGKYEHSFKTYDKKEARNDSQANLGFNREDHRHLVELYGTRYIGKFSVKLKGKAYWNTSNDHYNEYYDYESYRGYLTLAGSFLEDDKLYVSFTPSLERKNYQDRQVVDTARYDDVMQFKLSSYYTVNKNITCSYSCTYKEVDSNYNVGEYHDVTNQLGVYIDF